MTDIWLPYARRLAMGEIAYFTVHGHHNHDDITHRENASRIHESTDAYVSWKYTHADPEAFVLEDAWIEFPENDERIGNYFDSPVTMHNGDGFTLQLDFVSEGKSPGMIHETCTR